MFLVALAELAGTVDDEAQALAQLVGVTAFETRILLARPVPTVVLRTADRAKAVELMHWLRARGHKAIGLDSAAMVARKDMVHPREIEFGSSALRSQGASLDYDRILLVLLAMDIARHEETTKTSKKKLSLGRAVATGGLKMSKKVSVERQVKTEARTKMLMLFPRENGTPWLLREDRLHYQCLGDDMAPLRATNFQRVVDKIRSSSPSAYFDSSLTHFNISGSDKQGARAFNEQAYVLALCAANGYLPGP